MIFFYLIINLLFSLHAKDKDNDNFTFYSKLLAELKVDKIKAYSNINEINKYNFKLMVLENNKVDELVIFSGENNEIVTKYSPHETLESFKYFNIIQHKNLPFPIFLSHWSLGAHGERVVLIYHKDSKWHVQEYKHDWPMVSIFKEDELVFLRYSEKNNEYKDSIIFRP